MKTVRLRKVKFDDCRLGLFVVEASLHIGNNDSRGLSVGGRLSEATAAKITYLIEEELGETVGAIPTSTGEPVPEDEDIPF